MREIKFRAWLPKAKKTVWSDYGTVKQREPGGRRRGRMVEFDPLYFNISHDSLEHPQIFTDTPEHFYGEDIDKSAEGAVLLQFTGLKDKNGVDIYEGDILRSDTQQLTAKVVWETPAFALQNITGQMGDFHVSDSYRNGKPCDYIEVIGNIYENPELLK